MHVDELLELGTNFKRDLDDATHATYPPAPAWRFFKALTRYRFLRSVGGRMTAITPLQEHMLRELARGKRLKEIAAERGAGPDAAKTMSKMLLRKVGLRTQFQLGAWAERHGYGEPKLLERRKMVDLPASGGRRS